MSRSFALGSLLLNIFLTSVCFHRAASKQHDKHSGTLVWYLYPLQPSKLRSNSLFQAPSPL